MAAQRAPVVVPESVNFFNNIAGHRLADALRHLGWAVEITSMHAYQGQPAEVAFLISLAELFVSCGDPKVGREKLARLRGQCGRLIVWLLEPARTQWFANTYDLLVDCGLGELADNSLHSQAADLEPDQRTRYRHLFYGLTEREKRQVRALDLNDRERVIPWSFIGYRTPQRIDLARMLAEDVDPGGLCYLTDVTPISEHGPHLKDATFQKVLAKTRYHLWRAHHSSFYMEGERFRRSALAGCIPVKIILEDDPGDRPLPFRALVVRPEELADRLAPRAFDGLRAQFLDEYCQLPSLEDELNRHLQTRPAA